MKSKILTIICLVAVFTWAGTVIAEETSETSIEADVNVRTPATKPVIPIKANLRTKVENKIERVENKLEKNAEVRNIRLEDKREMQMERKDIRASSTMMIKTMRASSTMMFKEMREEKREVVKKMKVDAFEIRKNALVKELSLAITNLTSIRERINERIIKLEGEGKSMVEAKAQLVVADDKLAKAKVAVDALVAYQRPVVSGSATSASTAEVDLDKPRKIGDEAIKAVKEAKEAFRKVIQLTVIK